MSANQEGCHLQLEVARPASPLPLPPPPPPPDQLEMPRVCRCCCKGGDLQLLSLFEASSDEATKQKQTQSQHNNNTAQTNQQQPQQQQQQQQQMPLRRHKTITKTKATEATGDVQQPEGKHRKSDNPVDYALSRSHNSMDTVREEMIVWMLNISHNDGLPQEICLQCKAQFIMVAKFRRRCLRTQQRLLEFAQQITKKQQQQEQLELKVSPKEQDYMHLPESQMERKRRLVLSQMPPQPISESKPETEEEHQPPPPKMRRFQLRLRNMRISSLPSEEAKSDTGTTVRSCSVVRDGCKRISSPKSVYKKLKAPWKTKAARKQISDSSCTSCSTTNSSQAGTNAVSDVASSSSCSTSSGHSSPEQLSDLSVNPLLGFESDSNLSPVMSGSNGCPTKLKLPPKRSPVRSHIVLRRARRPRLSPSYLPVKRSRRLLKKDVAKDEAVAVKVKENGADNRLEAPESNKTRTATIIREAYKESTSESTEEEVTINPAKKRLERTGRTPEPRRSSRDRKIVVYETETSTSADSSAASSSEESPRIVKDNISKDDATPSTTVEDSGPNNSSEKELENGDQEETSDSSELLEQPQNSLQEIIRNKTQSSELLDEQPMDPTPPATVDELELMSETRQEISTAEVLPWKSDERIEQITEKQHQLQAPTGESPEATTNGKPDILDSMELSLESPVQFEELTSSTTEHSQQSEDRKSETPEVPVAECEVEVEESIINDEQVLELEEEKSEEVLDMEEQKAELIVSIPLDALDEELQHKLCHGKANEEESNEEDQDVDMEEPKDPGDADDVNNNENGENFCQSATADSFNSAVALANNKEIEADTNKGGGGSREREKEDPPVDDDMNTLEELIGIPIEQEEEQTKVEIQMPRISTTPMDFLAEFEKHCEKSLKMETAARQEAAKQAELQLEKAKQQMEVEMNDVESTLHGILNEMQDQHLYTPVCTPMDEFLTPADYAADEVEVQPEQQVESKDSQLFDSSNFSNELIGFQNDMPCFENIEAAPESVAAQHSLQLELTQLLNELQPAQPQQPLQPETMSYETLYPATVPTVATPLTSNPGKLQLIQMPQQESPQVQQETLWQAQAASQQTTHLQWSTVGGLEAIKTTPSLEEMGSSTTTTTYYINASDLYQAQSQQQQQQQQLHSTGDIYAMLDNNENYLLEQQEQTQAQQQIQQQQQQQQPIMILIQQPQELQQPVASASNPQQAPLHITYASTPLQNELHPYQTQQQQQQQQRPPQQLLSPQAQQHLLSPQQQLTSLLAPPTRGRPPMLKCRFCQNGPRFSSSLEYSRHIIELHPAVAPFNCPHCPQAFAGRSKRNQHILSHHVVQQFHCGQCSQMFPSQRALDLHLQRFHMPLNATGEAGNAAVAPGVRLEEVQLQMANNEQQPQQQQHHRQHPQQQPLGSPHLPALELQTSPSLPRRTRILCCPDCEDCPSASGHHHSGGQQQQHYEELPNLQAPPTVLTPPSTIGSLPSPQPLGSSPHITLPSPEQSEPDSTTATLRQFRKRCVVSSNSTLPMTAATTTTAAATTTSSSTLIASPSPSSSPSSSTMEAAAATLQISKLRGSHQCVVCDKRFTNIIALRKHQQLAHDSQTTMPWVCTICKRGYRKRTDMDNHMKSHEPKGRPYECNECWVRFPEFKQLAMHKFTVHELIKPHTCDECGKQFGTESALKTHIKFHGERGFQCEECDATFVYIKDFRKHRRTHNSELFYKCKNCPRTFLHFTSFRAHMNTHLPLGVFLNDKSPTSVAAATPSKLENPLTPTMNEELLPLTPLSNCNSSGGGGGSEDCPGSVEQQQLVESSAPMMMMAASSLEMLVDTP